MKPAVLYWLGLIGGILGGLYGVALMPIAELSTAELREMLEAAHYPAVDDQLLDNVHRLADLSSYYTLFNLGQAVGCGLLLWRRARGFHVYAASLLGQAGIFGIALGFANAIPYFFWQAAWCAVYYLVTRQDAKLMDDNSEPE